MLRFTSADKVRTPVVDIYPEQAAFKEGTDLIFICRTRGNPPPNYLWFKNHDGNTILSQANTLEIKHAMANDTGLYVCSVSNSYQNTEYRSSFAVNVVIGK